MTPVTGRPLPLVLSWRRRAAGQGGRGGRDGGRSRREDRAAGGGASAARRAGGHARRPSRSPRPRVGGGAASSRPPPARSCGLIAASPLDVQRVLDAVAERAARLCDTYEALIHRVEGDMLPLAASYPPPDDADTLPPAFRQASKMMAATGSACRSRGRSAGARCPSGGPSTSTTRRRCPTRSIRPAGRCTSPPASGPSLATPLLRHGVAIGAILLRRMEVRPFTAAADRAPGDVRRAGRDRDRERPAVRGAGAAQPRVGRGAGAADGHGRGPAGDRRLADRRCGPCWTPWPRARCG